MTSISPNRKTFFELSNPFAELIPQALSENGKRNNSQDVDLSSPVHLKLMKQFQEQLSLIKQSSELIKTNQKNPIPTEQIENYRKSCSGIIEVSQKCIQERIKAINQNVIENCLALSEIHATQIGMPPGYLENYGHGTTERLREIENYLKGKEVYNKVQSSPVLSTSDIDTYIVNLAILAKRAAVIKERVLSTKQKFIEVFSNKSLKDDNKNKLYEFESLEETKAIKLQEANIECKSLERRIAKLKDSLETHLKDQERHMATLKQQVKINENSIHAATKAKKPVLPELKKQIALCNFQEARIQKLIDQTILRLGEIEPEMLYFQTLLPVTSSDEDEARAFKPSGNRKMMIDHQQSVVGLKEELKNFMFNELLLSPDNTEILNHFYSNIFSRYENLTSKNRGTITLKLDTLVTKTNNSIQRILKDREALLAISKAIDLNFEQVKAPEPTYVATVFNAVSSISGYFWSAQSPSEQLG